MELIIDIPEEIYKASKIINVKYEDVVQIPLEVIANGTPIPDNATNVLDVIKLEIKQEYDKQGDWSFNDGLTFALDIIDKYKAESEEQTECTHTQ